MGEKSLQQFLFRYKLVESLQINPAVAANKSEHFTFYTTA